MILQNAVVYFTIFVYDILKDFINQGNIILKNETGGAWDNDEKK